MQFTVGLLQDQEWTIVILVSKHNYNDQVVTVMIHRNKWKSIQMVKRQRQGIMSYL